MLDNLVITKIGLHSGDTGLDGLSNELISAGYSRQSCNFNLTSQLGSRTLTNDVSFSLSGGDSIRYISYWNDSTFILSQEIDVVDFAISGNFTLVSNTTVISI